MQTHRRLAEAVEVGEIRALRAELADRFGTPPPAVVRLLRLAELRLAATRRGLSRVETRGEVARLIRRRDQQPLLAGDRLPRLKGRTADQKLTSLFRLLGDGKGALVT
jgi:transcription-repair coupling factor (superfamily II helicase)